MSVTVIALKHALLVSMDILLNQLIQFYSINTTRLRRLTQHIMSCYIHLYPQNGDCIVTVDSVTSLYPMYNTYTINKCEKNERFCTVYF